MWRRLLLLVLAAAVLVGCRVDTTVTVTVDDDGTGAVAVEAVFDEAAAAAIGDLGSVLRLDDARAAGWTVVGPEPLEAGAPDAGARVEATKTFANPEQFAAIMAELSGPDGALQGFSLDRSRSFGRTTYRVEGAVDLSEGLEAFGDAGIAEELGTPLGWTVDELEAELGAPAAEAFGFSLRLNLPGSVSADGATLDGDTAVWSPRLGDPAVPVMAEGRLDDLLPAVLAAVALGALALLIFVLLVRWLRWRRHRPRRRPERRRRREAARAARRTPPVPSPDDAGSGAPAPAAGAAALVVVGAHGVLYTEPRVVARLFGPFARRHGSTAPPGEIADRFREATLGRRTSAELWAALGVLGDPADLDDAYLERLRPTPGALTFLQRVRSGGLVTACLANDLQAWSTRLRRRDGYEPLIDHWVVSGETGVRMPDPAMFEALRRRTGVAFVDMVFVDRRGSYLDAARRLGITTVWFAPTDDADRDGPHRLARSFAEILATIGLD